MLNSLLSVAVLRGVSQEIEDIRNRPEDLLGLKRVNLVPADDGDVFLRMGGRTIAADVIADGSAATIKSMPQTRLTQTHIPNIKGGRELKQGDLNVLARLQNNAGVFPAEVATIKGSIIRHVDDAIRGVQIRMNQMIWGMFSDNLSFDSKGFKATNVTWGVPSDLKVTPSTAWSSTSATPVTDVNSICETGRVKYGIIYDRMTLSTTALRNASKTTEFQSMAQAVLFPSGSATVIVNSASIGQLAEIASKLFGLIVEVYDDTFDEQATDGTITATRFLAVNRVVLSRSADDGNNNAFDFANAVVSEAIVSDLMGSNGNSVIGQMEPMSRGPVTYAEGSMNPPQIGIYGVARGFPRKHKETATAILIVA